MKYISLVALIFLCACTPYQSKGFSGGYSQTQLSENVYRVTFKGNGYTDAERAADFAMLRAAELGIEKKYSYFLLLNADNDTEQHSNYTPPTYNCMPMGGFMNCTGSGGGMTTSSKPSSSNTVAYFRSKPKAKGIVYNCQFIYRSISEKYKLNGYQVKK